MKKAPYLYDLLEQSNSKKLKNLAKALYDISDNPWLKGIGPAIFVLGSGVGAYFHNLWIIIPSILLGALFQVFIVQTELYKNLLLTDSRTSEMLLLCLGAIKTTIAIKVYENVERICRHQVQGFFYYPSNYDVTFDVVCKIVASDLYHTLTKALQCDDIYITIFARSQDKSKEINQQDYIQMCAYANRDKQAPHGYNKERYYLHERYSEQKDYVHRLIFNENIDLCKILLNIESVRDEFVIIGRSKQREESIHQYIGIPIYNYDQGIIALLQIDTTEKDLFGKTDAEVTRLIDKIKPISYIIHESFYRTTLSGIFDTMFDMQYSMVEVGQNGQGAEGHEDSDNRDKSS